ncbi:MAG: isoamylase early set domain-containing protein [Oscillochloridaceae bacterium umkhey_bin13]
MITKRPGRVGMVRVTFAIPAAIWADSIHVVGDFNGWDERATPLRQAETGWMATLELDAGQSFQYRYLFNGTDWHNDWQADGYAPNAFGGDNSVLITPVFDDPPARSEPPGEHVLSFTPPRLRLISTG